MRRQNYKIVDKLDWYEAITELIDQGLEDFIAAFYPESTYKKLSSKGSSFSLEPCPVCGHKDCCRISTDHGVKCFSCDWGSPSYITSWIEYATTVKNMSYYEAIKKMETFFHLPFPAASPADIERHQKHQRQQDILKQAEKFYHDKLLNEGETISYDGTWISPYKYLVNKRRRTENVLNAFAVGYSKDFLELKVFLLSLGYTEDEIKLAKIKVPDGLIVYFYHHPISKEIVRINTKNPFGVKAKFYDENGNEAESDNVLEGWSSGEKLLYCGPSFTFKKPVVIVEGENDEQAIYERGFTNVGAIGGNPSPESLKILSRCEAEIYTFFDNDDVGEKYTVMINDLFPDKVVKKIHYDATYNDPDEYYKNCPAPIPIEELMKNAETLTTEKYRISHEGNTWVIKDRTHAVEFIIKKRSDKGQLVGQANLYDAAGKLKLRNDDTALVKCKNQMAPFSFFLSDAIENHFNSNLDNCSFTELAERYYYSSKKDDVIFMLAKHLFEAENGADEMVVELKRIFKGMNGADKVIDKILIELSNLKNEHVVKEGKIIPRMKIAQYYNMLNGDAYFYFTYRKDDGDAQRVIPYLLKNDKTAIRLDLLKRKDQQCLLLVDNKYELPFEIPTAIFDTMSCSLHDRWVEEWQDGKIDEADLAPKKLLGEIEAWIRKFYFSRDESIYKILSMWIYGTYFYVMFSQYPYLYVNGEKGSGKTVLNNVLTMLTFNGRTVVDTSEASLFRMAAVEGGTIMLDEQETITSRTAAIQNDNGSILKAGYASGTFVTRFNLEKNAQDLFDPFCPKVISNIFGLDDIIMSRCMPINTYRLSVSRDLQIEDPKYYIENDQEKYRELTSKICISALTHFRELNTIYRDKSTLFESEDARLSQILTPILAIAKFADKEEVEEKKMALGLPFAIGEYEAAFAEYHKNTIQLYRNETEDNTPEGVIKRVVKAIAMELAGKTAEREYTVMANRKYSDAIVHDLKEGWFELNVLHFKCFLEENMPGEQIYSRIVPKWLKTCFNFDKSEIKRKTIRIDNEDLVREMRGVRSMKVNTYRFYIKDFVKSDFLEEKPLDKTEEPPEKPDVF